MSRIDQVAALAGVSTATVSRALSGKTNVSEKTRQRVVAAAKELDYSISLAASSLATGRTSTIGVVVPQLDRWFFTTVITGIQSRLIEAGYDLTLYTASHDREKRRQFFEHFFQKRRVDALITVALELTGPEVAALRGINRPIVAVGGSVDGIVSLGLDENAVARLATEHLLSFGHRIIGYVGGAEEFNSDFHLIEQRFAGLQAALAERNLQIERNHMVSADFTIAGGYSAAKRLLGRPGTRPTAIFAASDEMALGAMLAARDLGFSIPGDLSIIGIDGHDLSEPFGLTTVAQFPANQGRRAAELVLGEIDGSAAASATLPIDFELIVRRSTRRAAP